MVAVRTETPAKPLVSCTQIDFMWMSENEHAQKAALERIWKHRGKYYTKREQAPHPSCPPMHVSISGEGAKWGERVQVLGWCCCTLPHSLGCGQTLHSALPLLPTSLPAGLQQSAVQAPSTLPVLPGTQRVRCSLAAHIRVCACLCRVWGVQGCAGCRDSPGCPSVNHQGFLLLHFMNSLLCFFLSKR